MQEAARRGRVYSPVWLYQAQAPSAGSDPSTYWATWQRRQDCWWKQGPSVTRKAAAGPHPQEAEATHIPPEP